MSCNPNAPLELAAANRSLQRQEESRTECLLGHFAALQGSPLPDCCCENPDRACRSERSGNAAASWCKTNSLFMLECRSLFSLSRKIREFKHARSQAINVPAVVADSSRQRIIIPTRPRIIIVPCRLLLTPRPDPTPPGEENSLWVKRGGLSLTSVSLTVTVVVPESPPRCPPMSLAWRSTRYWSCVSLSMSGTAVRRIPASQTRRSGGEITVANVHVGA